MGTSVETKEEFLKALYARDTYIRTVSDVMHLTRCPYCGDSSKTDHGHFYIKVDLSDDSPILFKCFKCPEVGIVTKDVIERLGIDNSSLSSKITLLNKSAGKYDKKQINSQESITFFDYKLPEIKNHTIKTKYIENRLGIRLTKKDIQDMKVIISLKEFNRINRIEKPTCTPYIADLFEKYYVGFLSFGSSHILFRDVTETQDISWVKYPITSESQKNKIFYSIGTSIDIFTHEDITINLFEGIFDTLSIHMNFEKDTPNTINIAITGKYYESIMLYLIGCGFFGENVYVNIYADNDAMFNKKNKGNDTTLDYYKKLFRNYKYLFHAVNVYYNMISKDCGVPKDQISLKKYKI